MVYYAYVIPTLNAIFYFVTELDVIPMANIYFTDQMGQYRLWRIMLISPMALRRFFFTNTEDASFYIQSVVYVESSCTDFTYIWRCSGFLNQERPETLDVSYPQRIWKEADCEKVDNNQARSTELNRKIPMKMLKHFHYCSMIIFSSFNVNALSILCISLWIIP